jgi:hypothetical protein
MRCHLRESIQLTAPRISRALFILIGVMNYILRRLKDGYRKVDYHNSWAGRCDWINVPGISKLHGDPQSMGTRGKIKTSFHCLSLGSKPPHQPQRTYRKVDPSFLYIELKFPIRHNIFTGTLITQISQMHPKAKLAEPLL